MTSGITLEELRSFLVINTQNHCNFTLGSHVGMLGINLRFVCNPSGQHIHWHLISISKTEFSSLIPSLLDQGPGISCNNE
nr:hypothetical protein Iba_chr05aCG12810 [Ipomoea batatas]GME14340.1 hypothetical protein Iba_scaffold15165CG0130 [Ipomoea batatas]